MSCTIQPWLLAPVLVLAGALATTVPSAARQPPCNDIQTRSWLDQALTSWTQIVRTELRLEPRALPWIVAFDAECAWNVNADGQAGVTVSSRHGGTIRLPDGATIPARLATFVATYGQDQRPFLVTALPPIWRSQARQAKEPSLPTLIRSVFMHEMTHTLQSSALGARIGALETRHTLTDLTDNVIQDRFSEVPGFRDAYERERDFFFAAATSGAPATRLHLGRIAFDTMVARRARYLSGTNAHFAELEDLFLIMEGAANWTAYRSAIADGLPDYAAQYMIRGDRGHWSQDEGLAIFMFLDAAGTNWRADVFSAQPSSVVDLVRNALN